MKERQNFKVSLIDTDTLDSDNTYYLYEIETNNAHYYYCTSDEELKKGEHYRDEDFSSKSQLIERQDMNDKEWHIAKVLFQFLWNSNNGVNTCMDYEQLEEENISKEEIEKFWSKFPPLNISLDMYEEDGVEIYWQFLCSFDLNSCNFFEDYKD